MLKHATYALALMTFMALPLTAQARDMQPYLGIGLGVFGFEHSQPGFRQRNTVFGGFVKGGVDINDYLGIELRAGSTAKGKRAHAAGMLGSPTPFSLSQRADYFVSYLAKLQVPVSSDMSLYALVGATTAKTSASVTPAFTSFVATTKTGLSYGAGFDAEINDRFTGGLEWMQYWTKISVGPNQKEKLWGAVASVSAHF